MLKNKIAVQKAVQRYKEIVKKQKVKKMNSEFTVNDKAQLFTDLCSSKMISDGMQTPMENAKFQSLPIQADISMHNLDDLLSKKKSRQRIVAQSMDISNLRKHNQSHRNN